MARHITQDIPSWRGANTAAMLTLTGAMYTQQIYFLYYTIWLSGGKDMWLANRMKSSKKYNYVTKATIIHIEFMIYFIEINHEKSLLLKQI